MKLAQIPHHIATAHISPRAKELWMLLAFESSPEQPEVAFHNKTVAEQIGCSPQTISRAKKILLEAGFLRETNKRRTCGCQIYELLWTLQAPVVSQLPQPEQKPAPKLVLKPMPLPKDETEDIARMKISSWSHQETIDFAINSLKQIREHRWTIGQLQMQLDKIGMDSASNTE